MFGNIVMNEPSTAAAEVSDIFFRYFSLRHRDCCPHLKQTQVHFQEKKINQSISPSSRYSRPNRRWTFLNCNNFKGPWFEARWLQHARMEARKGNYCLLGLSPSTIWCENEKEERERKSEMKIKEWTIKKIEKTRSEKSDMEKCSEDLTSCFSLLYFLSKRI